jgi:phage portal protein BeeE
LEQAQLQFVTNTLAPYIDMLEEELNRKLILPKDRLKYYIDVVEEDIIKQDKQSQVNYLNTLVNSGIITRNEARKQLGYSPVEGGDELIVAYTDVNQNKINQDSNTDNEEKNTDENEDEQ